MFVIKLYVHSRNTGINPFGIYQMTGSGTGQNMRHAKVHTTSSTSSFSNLLTLVHVWDTHPSETLTPPLLWLLLCYPLPPTAQPRVSNYHWAQIISITQIHEKQIISCPRGPSHPSPNIHHKKLLTQCDCETKTKGVVGKKYSEKYNVFLYSAVASLFSFSCYKTWCHLVRSFLSFSTAKRALSWQKKHLK